METIFVGLYDFFKSRKGFLYSLLVGFLLLFGYGATQITIEEDISKFFPVDEKLEKINQAFQRSRFAERLVVMVSLADSTAPEDSDKLIFFTDSLVDRIQNKLPEFVRDVNYRVNDDLIFETFDVIFNHLPVFLNEKDYQKLDSLVQRETIKNTLANNYKQLVSPAGLAFKKIIAQDPANISQVVLAKLQSLQVNEDFTLHDNYFFSKDHRFLLFFISPAFPPNDTGNNSVFLKSLDEQIQDLQKQLNLNVQAQYFGAAAVAAGNANQLNKDTILTITIMISLMVVFLFGFLRKATAPILILAPVLFGALFSLGAIWLIQGTISVLAIAAGSIVLGIAINYSLHFFSHLKETNDVRQVVKDLVQPMTLGSATTVLAFLSLQFANASMLRDIGLFAGFSLIGAALCSLVFLPHFITNKYFESTSGKIWKVPSLLVASKQNRFLVVGVFILTPVMLYFANDVRFNSDMNKLNFMTPELKKTETALNNLTGFASKSVFVVSDGPTLESALRENEKMLDNIEQLKKENVISKFSSVSSFLISDSLQQLRLKAWSTFWSVERKKETLKIFTEECEKAGFSKSTAARLDSLINGKYSMLSAEAFNLLRKNFFDDYVTETKGLTTIVTPASIDPNQVDTFYKSMEGNSHTEPFDKRMLTNLFVKFVHADFTFIVTTTSLIVFFILLISYGRIELTLMAFLPMLITWIWILGAMALIGIEFNIVNVMISTFIFGLGDDYSIFVMDGLLKEYRTGQKTLPSVQDSIFLSAITTISGLGVLIFAQHPALKSIAAISIIGIVMVWIMSQTIAPYLFAKIITDRTKKKYPPTTLFVFFITYAIYFVFVSGAVVLTIIGFLQFKVMRLTGPKGKYFYHSLIRFFTGIPIYMGIHITRKFVNLEGQYERPMVIICNHTSFIDILLTSMLHPKVVLLTNNWVWNSPIFGWVVRMADFYPIDFGVEASVESLRPLVKQGYSIVIFPEGTRSPDGKIQRFHKGAFYLAEQLEIDILPLLIYGAIDSIRKGDLNIHHSQFGLYFLPPIKYNDPSFGSTYKEKAKLIGLHFRTEHNRLEGEFNTPKVLRHKLISNYLYKGPVLEWYMRIKIKLEDYYQPFHQLIPKQASVLDLGCGYGFLCYMLHFLEPQRTITGVDYDDEKIAVAANGYWKGDNLGFVYADVTRHPISQHDVIIISDVLHYLDTPQQEDLLNRSIASLNPGGILIVRDGDQDLNKHAVTELSEFFSIKLLKFNKSVNALNFVSGEKLKQWAKNSKLEIEVIKSQKHTSNVIFAIRNK